MEGRKMNRDLVDNYIEIELIIVEFRRWVHGEWFLKFFNGFSIIKKLQLASMRS
jgi:hypothetical protein